MRKIPTVFLRDPDDRRFVTSTVQAGCEWVLAGEGQATRKYDGTCVLFAPAAEQPDSTIRELQGWWARRELKPGVLPVDGSYWIVDHDDTTGKTVGWEPADRSPFAKYLAEAVANLTDGPHEGTHELLGPKINRDPERIGRHIVLAHADADPLTAPRDFEGLTRYLLSQPYEGIVWHHPDGRMAKLKRRDVRRG